MGGLFYACSNGYSSINDGLGEHISFTYPKNFLGVLQLNTFFNTDNGEMKLLCYNEKSESDDVQCYAYISLETVRDYMTKDGYFTDNSSGIWSFEVRKPSVIITSPKNSTPSFNIGDTLSVKAEIDKVAYAKLIVGQHTESKDNLLNLREVTFSDYILTSKDTGDLTITVEANTGGTAIGAQTIPFTAHIQIEEQGDNISYESALAKALRLTATFEGGGVTGNFDGQGLSMGMFQFNFGQKSLQPLLLDMISQHPGLMKSIFGTNYDKLDTILKSSYVDQMIWVKSINDSNSKIIEPWKRAFTTLNDSAEFNSIQLNSATFQTYVTQTKSIVDTYDLKTERGIALAFDISIQNWGTNGDDVFINKILAMTNESDKLQAISDRVINKSSSEYQADVKSRKYTIVNGTGTVHGIQYNLSDSKYDILDRVWY